MIRNNDNENILDAVLYSDEQPTDEQKRKLITFLENKYEADIVFSWQIDNELKGGFRLEINTDGDEQSQVAVYDWSLSGRLQQLEDEIRDLTALDGNIVPLIQETIQNWTPQALEQELGTVLTVGDGIATISGLANATYGEILIFSCGARAMVQELKRDKICCILFGNECDITEGSIVKRTGKTAGVSVGDGFLGRVINALGNPIDGKGPIKFNEYKPIESPAPSIIDRQPVNEPIETGILAIDSMFPIGRGQRELIIGDRQTGKTAIALDTILNQKGKDIICIYVAIGQKASSVAKLVNILEKHGALEYSIIVNATASDPAPLQYISPYVGCTLGEYFMQDGRDVLIVYDDLSKHAVAYRSLSLLLERSPGREAYPGDVFYLHSRLLERSAHLSDAKGGGSMTAFPIVETQVGDVSAYIPTNIISITDGQIFLESDLFFAGQRPAVNIGLSVSRVGGDAQTSAMKKATGTLRLELAQAREMEIFMQFSSDLDEPTKRRLVYGQGLTRLLRQEQYSPMKLHEQVITLIAALARVMQDVPLDEIGIFNRKLLSYIQEKAPHICHHIDHTGDLTVEMRREILNLTLGFLTHSDVF